MDKVNGYRPNPNDKYLHQNKMTRMEYQKPETSQTANINNHKEDDKKKVSHPNLGQAIDLKY